MADEKQSLHFAPHSFSPNKKIIAKPNAKAKLRNIIIPILNKGEFSEADFATLAEFAKENALDEADVRKSITECALQILPKKIKEALKDFNDVKKWDKGGLLRVKIT